MSNRGLRLFLLEDIRVAVNVPIDSKLCPVKADAGTKLVSAYCTIFCNYIEMIKKNLLLSY